ncbi:hypothetical protein ABZ896_12430 [Streptomyces sp. NPDC047072]|uniref:hypothetical protein n=1 Tax=Streptomyces sp. NPDC047072 TaxID=3154809 RepID=UPI0033EA8B33
MTGSGSSRSMIPVAAAWKQNFHLATDGSGAYTKGLNLQRNDAVGQIHAGPGRIAAAVAAKKGTHKPVLLVPEFSADEWHALADRLAGIPQAVADLLANRVPAAVADPAVAGRMAIVPAPEEITFSCSCPTGHVGRVCDHSAALGHAIAERLTTHASVLLAARGMTTRALSALLRDRLADTGPGSLPAEADGTVRADQLYSLAAHRALQPVAVEPELDTVAPLTMGEPPAPCPAARDLEWMINDAAARARALLNGEAGQPHDALADTVRILATPDGVSRLPEAVRTTGHTEATLRRMMVGYRHGGPAGAHAASAPIPTPRAALEEARAAIQSSRALGLGRLDITDGSLTDDSLGIQLRPGPDGRWYPFTKAGDEWRPAPGCSDDPARAYQAARRARAARPAAR